jgi:hypothetical protein
MESHVEVGSNAPTVTMRVAEGGGNGNLCLGVKLGTLLLWHIKRGTWFSSFGAGGRS